MILLVRKFLLLFLFLILKTGIKKIPTIHTSDINIIPNIPNHITINLPSVYITSIFIYSLSPSVKIVSKGKKANKIEVGEVLKGGGDSERS